MFGTGPHNAELSGPVCQQCHCRDPCPRGSWGIYTYAAIKSAEITVCTKEAPWFEYRLNHIHGLWGSLLVELAVMGMMGRREWTWKSFGNKWQVPIPAKELQRDMESLRCHRSEDGVEQVGNLAVWADLYHSVHSRFSFQPRCVDPKTEGENGAEILHKTPG